MTKPKVLSLFYPSPQDMFLPVLFLIFINDLHNKGLQFIRSQTTISFIGTFIPNRISKPYKKTLTVKHFGKPSSRWNSMSQNNIPWEWQFSSHTADTLLSEKRQANVADDILRLILLSFQRKYDLTFHVSRLLGRRFTWYIKSYFLWKIKRQYLKAPSAAVVAEPLRINYTLDQNLEHI